MVTCDSMKGLNFKQMFIKRLFDIFLAFILLIFLWWVIVVAWFAATVDTRSNGFFLQRRVGKNGRYFNVIKIKTMRPLDGFNTTVTSHVDPRITKLGKHLRRSKIDELPQLINVLTGQMSFVGPRPDVPGFADNLEGESRVLLTIRPGITGPASLKYRNEEELLANQNNQEFYNKSVIWPDKVKINIQYIYNWSLFSDFKYILKTIKK